MTQDPTPDMLPSSEFSLAEEPQDLTPDQMTLPQLLERYATLRDTVQGLEAEKEELGALIKQALANGEQAETDLYRAELKVSRRVEYPLDRFREVFGDAAALEAATIDRRRAEALARAGDLDADRLKNLGVTKEIQVLRLVPKTF
ncbi:hypothetical protein [Deinococcus sp. Marseille-Q6407]|uniref:hypothetical protein n=1 Tax=Deinococcus sp. Marseille-Q6407 TaxID=2969223 RepID=UPI0039657F5A